MTEWSSRMGYSPTKTQKRPKWQEKVSRHRLTGLILNLVAEFFDILAEAFGCLATCSDEGESRSGEHEKSETFKREVHDDRITQNACGHHGVITAEESETKHPPAKIHRSDRL